MKSRGKIKILIRWEHLGESLGLSEKEIVSSIVEAVKDTFADEDPDTNVEFHTFVMEYSYVDETEVLRNKIKAAIDELQPDELEELLKTIEP